MMKHLKVLALIAFMGLAAFSNALHNPFLIDDHAFFEEKTRNIKYLFLHFLPDKDRALGIEGQSADPFYRPLATIVPMLSFLAFQNNTFGHHAVNLILLVLAGWGIYLFLHHLGAPFFWAVASAVLYVIHPINGVAVNYITASVFPVQVVLMLLSLYTLHRHALVRHEGLNSAVWFWASVFFYVLAMLCHETAMILPLYGFILLALYAPKESWRERLTDAGRSVWPLFVLLGVYIVWRMRFASLDASILGNIRYYHINFFEYLSTWTMLLAWYLSRLFWPQNIVLIMAHQPLKEGIWLWLGLLVVLLVLAGYLVRIYRRDKLILLGLGWFFLGFGPYTLACFFQVIHGLMIEPHWFLFPVIGFFIFLGGVLARFENGLRRQKVLGRMTLVILVFTCVFFSRIHNWLWADEVRYCTFWLNQSPSFAAVHAYLAKAYELRGDFVKARRHYQYIIEDGYKPHIAYTNFGLMDMQEGNWDSAEKNLRKSLELDPYSFITVNDLGVVYFKKERYEEALKIFQKARDLNRFAILPYLDISKTQLKLGRVEEAVEALEQALAIVPNHEIALTDLIQIYIQEKAMDKIISMARRIARVSQNPHSVHNAAVLLDYYGWSDEARSALAKARRMMR